MKILSVLVLLILLSTNCANETSSISTSGHSLDATQNYSSPTSSLENTDLTTVPQVTVNVETMELTSGLIPFKACEELLRYFQDEALERVGPYGLEGMGMGWGPMPVMAFESFAFEDSGEVMRAGPGIDFSETNVQEAGIDEPDFIKTNGQIIAVLQDNTLHVIDPESGSSDPLSSLRLDGLGWGSEMFLEGERVWVMARTDMYSLSPLTARMIPEGSWEPHTTIVEIDITDPTQPIQVASMVIEGSYVSARVVNDIARIVVSSPPSDLPFVTPQGPSAEEVALAANKQAIVGTTIENWVPSYVYESKEGNVTQGQLVDCKQVSHPSKFSGFTSLSVLDVELTSDMKPPAATSVLTDGETVYASPENLYISTTDYPEIVPFPEENSQNIEKEYLTSIHQFTMKLGEKTEYKASIEVKGHLLNQFAMSEHAGNLRVATTLGAPWGFDESNESVVTVIEISDEGLTEVGQVGGMGKGERIFAVRFVGNLGYVVTFRQTDPFYTLDLTDPKTPKVRGELKITGYSGYLHPIEENLILGIGQEATEEGATTGTKAALYDVEDLDNPKVITTWSPGSGRSSAEWDHHAFLWWPPEGIAVLPIRDWRNDKAEAVLLKIENGDLEEFGRITHSERGSPPDAKPEFMIPIERSLIVGGEIWTYSRGQLQANLMADLSVSKKVQLPILGMELIPGPLTTTEMELIPPTPTSMPVD
ncbi:MAG: beta-propeller domain-containing protein [Acidimicrobiales bacterium]|jgi:uncharacterized secreted protein with C-terminal beta-propeller domain|nr:beta-propeller domain-containing protein [Acidimicrobiales bacterium]MDP6285177.1 beta-propeller domain-containing protein [Acidimicrobiales bacterium]HJO40338.1 beta-propeller domain-containing protein [Acidimicrobiales bacterium]